MGKYSKKNLRGNWEEEDLQNAMRVVRTSRLSTNIVPSIIKSQDGLLEHIWMKISRVQ
jgi:hypothetical protein